MRRPVLVLVGVVLALSGCGSSSNDLSAKDVSHLVLRPQDLGARFVTFSKGPVAQLDVQGTSRADPSRFGREGGWIARYHRPGSSTTRGPLVVESRVDVFDNAGGAKKDLAAYREALAAGAAGKSQPLAFAHVGDASTGLTFVQPGAVPFRFYRVAWRYRNATASLTVQGFDQKLSKGDVLALVRKQQRLLAQG